MKSKSLILLLVLMLILLLGCRSNYHTEETITNQGTNEKEQKKENKKDIREYGDVDNTTIETQEGVITEEPSDIIEEESYSKEETSDKKEKTKLEIPYARFEECLYIWEDKENPLLLNGYIKLSENVDNQTYYYDQTDIKILEKKANYPDIVDDTNSKIKKAIDQENKKLKKKFDAQVAEALEWAKSDVQGVESGANKEHNKIAPYEFDNSWQVIRNDENMLTIVTSIYSYAGGAHPNLYKEVTSYNPVEGKKLDIASITTNELKFKQFVEDALYTYVVNNKCSDYLYGENGYKESFKNWYKNWWILDGKLYVGFNTYDIAPYVAGPLVIPVDITKARELLNDYGKVLLD